MDANDRGYEKNGMINLSGFLNHLLPQLSDYWKDIRLRLEQEHGGDEERVKESIQCISRAYINPLGFGDDGHFNVSLRVGKKYLDDFLRMYDEELCYFDTDFTKYVRILLTEYARSNFQIRQYLYSYRMMQIIKNAIEKSLICNVYVDGRSYKIIPVSFESAPSDGIVYLLGIVLDQGLRKKCSVQLCSVTQVTIAKGNGFLQLEEAEALYQYWDEFCDAELQDADGNE